MPEALLEPAVPVGVDPALHSREIQRVREVVHFGGWPAVAGAGSPAVIRPVIKQDWARMRRQGVDPGGVTPQFLDSRELESLQEDPDLTLTWHILVRHLGLVRNSEFMATVSDSRGCVVRTGGNTKVCDEADRYGFFPGAQWAGMGTNGIELVTQSRLRAVQIYGPEHWMDFQLRWTCTAVGIREPYTRRLLAAINVTGPWATVHSATLGWLYEIARRIEDALHTAPHRMQWGRLGDAAGRLERIDGPALVIDRDGRVVAAHQWTFQVGDRVILPEAARTAPGRTFLPTLNWCMLEPLPALGWLVRPLRNNEDKPIIRVTLDLTDPTQPWVTVTGPTVSWRSRVRPLHATILERLAGRPGGLTPAELSADLYGAGAKTSVCPEMSKLRSELGGLLHPTSHRPGDSKYRFGPNITVDIRR